ncbi:MAG TPA: hypothetical protein VKA83_22270 [Methylomirabilota bacterium]|nr:hypothetical protein [Methylomirabilota bacterium]
MTELDPAALDTAARAYAEAEGWPYRDDEPTNDAHLARAASVVDAYLAAISPGIVIGRYRLELPYTRVPAGLSANSRGQAHWGKSTATKRVRADVTRLATEAGIPECDHLTVQLDWAPGDRRKRDEDNLALLLKVCCDALARGARKDWVGLDLVPDDTRRYMTKHMPRILTPDETPERGMWLTVEARLAHTTAEETAPRAVRSQPPRADAGKKKPSDRPGASQPPSPVSSSAERLPASDAGSGPGARPDSRACPPALPLEFGQNPAKTPGAVA